MKAFVTHTLYQSSRSPTFTTSYPTRKYATAGAKPKQQPPIFDPQPWASESATIPRVFWKDPATHKRYLTWLKDKLGYSKTEDWYNVQKSDFKNASSLLTYYGGSAVKLLQTVYSEHNWESWKFVNLPRPLEETGNFKENLQKFVKAMEKNLMIKDISDWYRVSAHQISVFGATSVFKKLGGVYEVLTKAYPEHAWDKTIFDSSHKKATQRWLSLVVKDLLPNTEVKEEYMHPSLVFTSSKENMQFDIFVPKYNLAIEFYGAHHYNEMYVFGPRKYILERDEDKRQKCKAAGITLIEIPYWWDKTKESIKATLHKYPVAFGCREC